jgi:hypothetical protein
MYHGREANQEAKVADTISKIEYYSVGIPNKCGTGAQLMTAFKEAGVNFVATWGYPAGKGKAQVDLVPSDAAAFKKAARKLKIEVGPKQAALYVLGEDRVGAIAELLGKLAGAGVNVRALQALCGCPGCFGALIQVEQADARKAAKALGI